MTRPALEIARELRNYGMHEAADYIERLEIDNRVLADSAASAISEAQNLKVQLFNLRNRTPAQLRRLARIDEAAREMIDSVEFREGADFDRLNAALMALRRACEPSP